MKDNNQQETFTKLKSNKSLESITSKTKLTIISKIINIFVCIKKIIVWLITKIDSVITNCSILTQYVLVLIPFSIIAIVLIFSTHLIFYQNLYLFNFQKGIKEEFLDNYITEMDDTQAELNGFVTKENYIDIENQLFFEVYYRELASIGLLENENKRTFPNISTNSDTMYSIIDNYYKGSNIKDIHTIPNDISKKYVDDRGDQIGELAKIYYYMIPILLHSSYMMNAFINESYFISYEFDPNSRNIINNEIFFTFPRNKDTFNQNDNFTPNNHLLNPLINTSHFEHTDLISNSFYSENWFMKQDNHFREKLEISKNGYSNVSLAHLNVEFNGNINKSLILTTQQYVKSKNTNRYFIINIIFFMGEGFIKENEQINTNFIVKNNFNNEKYENEKYSDNETFVILKSDITEYSLSLLDHQYFHYGLSEINNSFFKNGVSFDSFNLDFLYDPFQFYKSVENFELDLKYLSTLYLYKTLFQTTNFSLIKKKREEVYLFNFNDAEKIQKICSVINFKSYTDYYEQSGINCWEKGNSIFYSKEEFQNISMIDIYSKYPFCSCIPLYCLNNYKNISNNFDEIVLASEINLPTKCQNKLISNEIEGNQNYNDNNAFVRLPKKFYNLIISLLEIPKTDYLKIKYENLDQLPGYYFLIMTQIKMSISLFWYYFFSLITQIEIIILVLGITIISSVICMIIMYVNLRRYSLIIKEFKKKHELFVFHSEENSSNDDNQKYKNNEKGKIEGYNMNNENMPLLQNEGRDAVGTNDNTLLDDLFSIFCKHYKLGRKDLEEYYSQQKHETKNQMKLKMMMEKNELFRLLSMYSVLAPIFRLNLSLDYKMYNYSKIIKKYDQYVSQVININKEQTRLTQNILYELLSTENISDYGLISNLNFKYISNIRAELKENCIQNAMFKNVINRIKGKNEDLNESEMNINDIFLIIKDGDEKQNIKLILKQKNELMEMFKNKFEADDYINFNKIESSFNFYLINSYYKYLKQIISEIHN